MTCPYVWSHGQPDGNGLELISVVLEEPSTVDSPDGPLYQGGRKLIFAADHLKQRTEIWQTTFDRGANRFIRTLKVLNEILVEAECLKWASEWYESK